jgi:hypothetical protein
MCEYRLYLQQKMGKPSATKASIRGEALHRQASSSHLLGKRDERKLIPIVIAIIAILIGLVWIMGR